LIKLTVPSPAGPAYDPSERQKTLLGLAEAYIWRPSKSHYDDAKLGLESAVCHVEAVEAASQA